MSFPQGRRVAAALSVLAVATALVAVVSALRLAGSEETSLLGTNTLPTPTLPQTVAARRGVFNYLKSQVCFAMLGAFVFLYARP